MYRRNRAFLGQENGGGMIASSTQDFINQFRDKYSAVSRDAVIDDVLSVVKTTYDALLAVINTGKMRFTPGAAQDIARLVSISNAALSVMVDMYGDTNFATVYPVKFGKIKEYQEWITKWIRRINEWNPAVSEVTAEIEAKQQEAMRAGNLESPYIGPGMKMLIIEAAYREPKNPGSADIIEKYSKSGQLKFGMTTIQPESRLRLIEQTFAEKGVPMPEEMKIAFERQRHSTEAGGGLGIGAIVAAGVAGLLAFFALS